MMETLEPKRFQTVEKHWLRANVCMHVSASVQTPGWMLCGFWTAGRCCWFCRSYPGVHYVTRATSLSKTLYSTGNEQNGNLASLYFTYFEHSFSEVRHKLSEGAALLDLSRRSASLAVIYQMQELRRWEETFCHHCVKVCFCWHLFLLCQTNIPS